MSESPFKAGMRQLASALTSAFEATAAIEHRGAKGEGREEALATQLRPFLPRRYELGSGEVVNVAGGRSDQQDLIVSDAFLGAPFLAQGRIGIHPAELVVAALQVKSRMTPQEARSGVENLASVKRLFSDEPRPYTRAGAGRIGFGSAVMKPFTGLIGYSLDGDWRKVVQAYSEACMAQGAHDRPTALLVLNELAVFWIARDKQTIITDPAQAALAQVFQGGADTVGLFYVVMMSALQMYDPPPLDLTQYLSAAGYSWTQTDVQLGV